MTLEFCQTQTFTIVDSRGHYLTTVSQYTNLLGREMKPVILGDPAYPLLRWLMKGYPENQTTPNFQRHFHFRLSRARTSVENTFGRWKGRFRRFLKRVDPTVNSITAMIAASCKIHKIYELRRHNFLAERLVGVCDTEDPPNANMSSCLQADRDAS